MRAGRFCEEPLYGVANDFQYVSTAPPISRVTPSKGAIVLTSKETFMTAALSKYSGGTQIDARTYFAHYMEPMI